jgi:soluble cytochrome b562
MTPKKTLARALALLLALTLVSASVLAADSPPPAPGTGAPAEEKKTDLETKMDKIGKAFRKLRKQVADPAQNASSLDLVATMLAGASDAATLTPAKAADLPEDQRAAFLEHYEDGIKDLQDRLTKLQSALQAGNNADAAAQVNDIFDFEKKEHKEFKKPKPE